MPARSPALPEPEAGTAPGAAASRCAMAGPGAGLMRALRGARGRRAAAGGWAGLRGRPDKYGGVSVELPQLPRSQPQPWPRRRERAAFGRWLRGKWRGPGESAALGGTGGSGHGRGAVWLL